MIFLYPRYSIRGTHASESQFPRHVIADAAVDMATTAAATAAAAVELTAIETDRNETCLDHDVTRQCLVEIVTAKCRSLGRKSVYLHIPA